MRSMLADVVVIGAGISGCAAAAALADKQRRIVVLEARQALKPRLAGELIHPVGVQVLQELGFMPELCAAGGTSVHGFSVLAAGASEPVRLAYRTMAGSRGQGFAIEHLALVSAMRRVVASCPGVELRFDQQVKELLYDERRRVCGVVTREGLITAPLVLGCDGRNSKVRGLLGVPSQSHLISFSAGLLLPDAGDLLACPGFGQVSLGADGPMLFYAISNSDVRCSFDILRDLSGGPRAAAELVRERYLPQLPAALRKRLAATLPEQLPQLAANEHIRTRNVVVPGAALIGDAGGCSHPLTATGISIGLTDAQRLGMLLRPVHSLNDRPQVDAALRQYEIDHYRFVRAREILADALYDVFRAADPGARAILGGVLRYWSNSEAARCGSMALLSGLDSSPVSFLSEYLKVVAAACHVLACGGRARPELLPLAHSPLQALHGLAGKSLQQLQHVAGTLGQELMRVCRHRLRSTVNGFWP